MKKIVLSALVTVAVVSLQGCADLHVNLSSRRDIKTDPFPMIGIVSHDDRNMFYTYITKIDGKPFDGWYAHVDQGSHEVEYTCNDKKYSGNRITGAGHFTIKVEPGTAYLLQSKAIVNNEKYTSLVDLQSSVVRDESGRLIKSVEPVYENRVRANVTGCTANVFTCKGYPYILANRGVTQCLEEPIGKLKKILLSNDQYMELF